MARKWLSVRFRHENNILHEPSSIAGGLRRLSRHWESRRKLLPYQAHKLPRAPMALAKRIGDIAVSQGEDPVKSAKSLKRDRIHKSI